MSENDFKQIDAYRYGCPGCGASLRYDIGKHAMLCSACGTTQAVSDLPDPVDEAGDGMMSAVEYVCPQCGAAVHTTQTSVTSFCSFCGADVMLTERLARTRRPAKIVPFRVTREKCEEIYRKRVGLAHYAPKELLAQQTVDRFRPVYIPYWKYKGSAEGPSTGSRVRRFELGDYEYTEEYAYDVTGGISVTGILYDASSAFDDDTAQQLGFSLSRMEDFHPAFLSGMYAEAPDVDPVVFRKRVEGYARQVYGGEADGAYVKARLPRGFETEAELVLMPVWLLASRQEGRVLYTAINGDSGEIVCETPVSRKRYLKLAGILFAGLLAALLAITHFVMLRANMLLALCGLVSVAGMNAVAASMDPILTRRVMETDPTRRMKREHALADVSIAEGSSWSSSDHSPKKEIGLRLWIFRKAAAFVAVAAVVLICIILFAGKYSEAMALMFSDHGFIPPALMVAAFFLSLTARYEFPKLASWKTDGEGLVDMLLVLVVRLLLIGGFAAMVSRVPGKTWIFYGLSLVLPGVMIAAMLRLSRLRNEFVTRPIPIFGKEEQS